MSSMLINFMIDRQNDNNHRKFNTRTGLTILTFLSVELRFVDCKTINKACQSFLSTKF